MALPDLRKLAKAVNDGHGNLDDCRKARRKAIMQVAGKHYPGPGNDKVRGRLVVNLAYQTASILTANLAPQKLKTAASTWNPMLRLEATKLGLAHDQSMRDDDFLETTREAVTEAILAPWAVVLTRLRAGTDLVKIEGKLYDPGQVYTTLIDFDDFAIDPDARRRQEARWEAHRYRVTRESLHSLGIYDPDRIDALPRLDDGDDTDDASGMYDRDTEKFELSDLVELWDVAWYEGDRTWIITFGGDRGAGSNGQDVLEEDPLYQEEFEGSERGPYEWLSFQKLPGQIIPLSPIAAQQDLADAAASVSSKIVAQMKRAKSNLAYSAASIDDAEAIRKARDGDPIKVDNPNETRVQTIPGPTADSFQWSEWIAMEWNKHTGSLQQMGGQGTETDKATIFAGLQAGMDILRKDKQGRVQRFLDSVVTQRCWFIATDPLIKKPLPYRVPGGEFITLHYDAAARNGSPFDFTYSIEMYAPEATDPAIKLARFGEFFGTILPGLMPLIQAGYLKLPEIVRMFQRVTQWDDLDDMVADPGLVMAAAQTYGGMAPMQPPQMTGRVGGGVQVGADIRGLLPAAPGAGNPAADPRGMRGSQFTQPAQMRSAYAPALTGQMR